MEYRYKHISIVGSALIQLCIIFPDFKNANIYLHLTRFPAEISLRQKLALNLYTEKFARAIISCK